jgi:hypothetical protein
MSQVHILKSICAIIDIQGFVRNNEFLPREVAIYNGKDLVHFDIDHQFGDGSFSSRDRVTNGYLKANLLGLSYRPKEYHTVKKLDELPELLGNLYFAYTSNEKFKFGINNNQAKKYLETMGIAVVDLSVYSVPKVATLEIMLKLGGPKNCYRHEYSYGKDWNCAVRKVKLLWKWMDARKKGLEILHELTGLDEVDK